MNNGFFGLGVNKCPLCDRLARKRNLNKRYVMVIIASSFCYRHYTCRKNGTRNMEWYASNGEGNTQCKICEKSFTRYDNLKRHVQNSHGNSPMGVRSVECTK